jgi:hypothetical protein
MVSGIMGDLKFGRKVKASAVAGAEQMEFGNVAAIWTHGAAQPVLGGPGGELSYGLDSNGKLAALGFTYDAAEFLSTRESELLFGHYTEEAEKISEKYGQPVFTLNDDFSYRYTWKAKINGMEADIEYAYWEPRTESSPAYIMASIQGAAYKESLVSFLQ